MTGNSPPPGWYTDGQGGQRWWDGSKWYEAAEPSTEAAAVGEDPVTDEPPVRTTESGPNHQSVRRPDLNTEAGQRRKAPKPSRPLARVLGSAIAIAGIALAVGAIVLLIMVNRGCLNNENCQASQSYWDLFGVKSSALVAGLLLVGAGFLVRRRAAQSAGPALETTGPEGSRRIAAIVRRKRVWVPVAAVTALTLAAGTWAVATAGPSDEERPSASEKRASAAAAEAERQELAKEFATRLMSANPDEVEKSIAQTQPGSVASKFAHHQLALSNALQDSANASGGDYSSEVTKTAQGLKVCKLDPDSGDPICTEWSAIRKVGTKYSDFSIDGEQLDERLYVWDKELVKNVPLLGTIEPISAWESPNENFVELTLLVRSKKKELYTCFHTSKFVGLDGRQRSSTDFPQAPDDIVAKSKAYVAITFPKAKLPGEVHMSLCDEDLQLISDVKFEVPKG